MGTIGADRIVLLITPTEEPAMYATTAQAQSVVNRMHILEDS